MPINVKQIINLQQERLIAWKNDTLRLSNQDFLRLVEENHAFNFQLWHEEDKARRDDQGPLYVYEAKRQIDYFNQQRNNRMEAMDQWLIENLKPSSSSACPLHSETPGMIIDRLSILALKIYHMNEQTLREEAEKAHRLACEQKKATLETQRFDLANCLEQLMEAVSKQEKTFKVYYQLKMYNDPTLNPQLYGTLASDEIN